VYKVVFREEHMFRRKDGAPFALQEYFDDPDRYESAFDPWLGHLTILANSIYWDSRYPRLVTRSRVRELHSEGSLRLEVIADITCDVGGSIELTTETTDQDRPILVYDPAADVVQRTWKGVGVAVLAVDNLPAEIPLDSSRHFSDSLYPFLPTLADLDHSLPFHRLNLPEGMQDAIIVWNGELTPSYQYLRDHL
jgi:alpha-aminoadipic semialdehyde synthase